MILYRMARLVARIGVAIVGCRVEGAENVPREGPCIIASNHINSYDPLFLASAMRYRMLRFIAKKALFEIPVFGWFISKLGAFPVSRDEGGDVSALRYSMTILKEGQALAIFPEGTRSLSGEMKKGMEGVGLIAERSKAPIIPVRILKIKNAKKRQRHKTRVYIGSPLLLENMELPEDRRERRRYIAESVMEKIAQLGQESERSETTPV